MTKLLTTAFFLLAAAQASAWSMSSRLEFTGTPVARAITNTISPGSEWNVVNTVVSQAWIEEEGTVVDSGYDDDTRQVFNGVSLIIATAVAKDFTVTDFCQYCAWGDGEVFFQGSEVGIGFWGNPFPWCLTYRPAFPF